MVVGDRLIGMVNAYYYVGCIGPETGTNIKPILDDLPLRGVERIQGGLTRSYRTHPR